MVRRCGAKFPSLQTRTRHYRPSKTEPVVAETVRHMLNLAVWLEDGGAQLFARPEAAIRHHFAAIATLAQRAGRNDLAKTASDLANTVHI